MGIGRFFLHDFFTAADLNAVDETLQAHETRSDDILRRVRDLERDLGICVLLSRGLADLCIERGILTKEQLSSRISDIDLLDGKLDGRVDAKAEQTGMRPCLSCSHRNPSSKSLCMYCGAILDA